jgi:hypothetical protein
MRKNLNDVIYGDRAVIRGGSIPANQQGSWQDDIDWGYQNSNGVISMGGPSHGSYSSKKSDHGMGGGYQSCYKTHPPLKLPGTDLLIYGGSCSEPVVLDSDVYIGFDASMRFTQNLIW